MSAYEGGAPIRREEQAEHFEDRRVNPLKQWNLSPIDVEAQSRWDAYRSGRSNHASHRHSRDPVDADQGR